VADGAALEDTVLDADVEIADDEDTVLETGMLEAGDEEMGPAVYTDNL
jgi:hypothetical protein